MEIEKAVCDRCEKESLCIVLSTKKGEVHLCKTCLTKAVIFLSLLEEFAK